MVLIPGDEPLRNTTASRWAGVGGATTSYTDLIASQPKPAPASAPKGPTSGAGSTADAALIALFNRYNMGGLAKVLIGYAQQGLSQDEAYLQLRETAEYKTRFAGNIERQKRFPKLAMLSEAEYINVEMAYEEVMHDFGLPKGFYDDPSDYAKLIGSNVGRGELTERLQARKALVEDGLASGALAYAQQKYGLGTGDLIAYFTDPDRAKPLLVKIAAASQVGAAAARARWGDISAAEAERIAALGFSAEQAQSGFGQAADMLGLTENLDGDKGVDRSDLVDATFSDDAEAKRRVTRKREERAGRFQGGGGYAEGRTGITGLGSANTR